MSISNLVASEQNIDVWLAFYHDIADESLHSTYRELLTEEERRKQVRFYFADDQRRYLVTRAMVRTVLSRYVPTVAPGDWRFSTNRYGRPQIDTPNGEAGGLSFNISHTRGLIALAVTGRRELGIDVENVVTREASIEIADRFFAPTEVAELGAVPPERQQDRFFEYWTFKESYIKARGMGLSIPLDQFSFHYPHERAVGIAIQPELGDDANRWEFWQYRPTADYLLAVCAERREGQAPTLTFRKTIPTVMDHVLEPSLLRTSEPPRA
jgi:4'-phosphopantetheinyl transferase